MKRRNGISGGLTSPGGGRTAWENKGDAKASVKKGHDRLAPPLGLRQTAVKFVMENGGASL